MDFISPLLGIGSLLFGSSSAARTNRQNVRMARETMAFQERMSSTAHQREVKDLVAAGLNPALSATGGSGASSMSGAMAQMEDEGAAGIRGMEAAVAMNQARLQSRLTRAQAETQESIGAQERIKAEIADKTKLQAIEAESARLGSATATSHSLMETIGDQIKAIRARAGKDLSDAEISRIEALQKALRSGIPSEMIKAARAEAEKAFKQAGGAIGDIVNSVRNIGRIIQ